MNRPYLSTVLAVSSLFFLVGKSHAWDDLPPIPDINNPSCQYVCVGCPVQFDGSTSYDQDEEGESIEHWYWWYGDGGGWHDDGPTPTHTYDAAGEYWVWLYVVDDEGTESLAEDDDCCCVYVVQVDKVVKSGTTDEGPLYVCLNDTVFLQAKPCPTNGSFPGGEPHWTIETQPPGGSASFLGGDPSGRPIVAVHGFNKIGHYWVRARCGIFDVGDSIRITAYTVKHQTVSALPDDRERTTLGIGEKVTCWTEPAVEVDWDVDLWGYVDPDRGTSTTFTAWKTPSCPAIHVTPTAGGCSHILNFTVIAPTGENNVLLSDNWSIGTRGPPNRRIGSSHDFTATILPTSVSFAWVEFRENIPINTWTWPDGTDESWGPDHCSFAVGYSNKWVDDCTSWGAPIERIFDGINYVDFTIPLSIPEEYKNQWAEWVSFLPGERHDVEHEGDDQASRHVIHATDTAPGNWMGPWQ